MEFQISWSFSLVLFVSLHQCEPATINTNRNENINSYEPYILTEQDIRRNSHTTNLPLPEQPIQILNSQLKPETSDRLVQITDFGNFVMNSDCLSSIKNVPVYQLQLILDSAPNELEQSLYMLAKVNPGTINMNKILRVIQDIRKFPPSLQANEIHEGLIELESFIINVVQHRVMSDISDVLVKIVLEHPGLDYLINEVFQRNGIAPDVLDPFVVQQLLKLIAYVKTGTPIEVPQWLVQIILGLHGTQILTERLPNWDENVRKMKNNPDTKSQCFNFIEKFVLPERYLPGSTVNPIQVYPPTVPPPYETKPPQTFGPLDSLKNIAKKIPGMSHLQYFLQGINEKEPCWAQQILFEITRQYCRIPADIYNWFTGLNTGDEAISLLKQDDSCYETPDRFVVCGSTSATKEFIDFIFAVGNNEYKDISEPTVSFFVQHPGQSQKIIEGICKTNKGTSRQSPDMITKLLNLIKDIKTNQPLMEVPQPVFRFLLNLTGANGISSLLLDLVPDKLKFLQQCVAENDGHMSAKFEEWIKTLPDGEGLIKYFKEPKYNRCEQGRDGSILCIKASVKKELTRLINDAVYKSVLYEPKPEALQYLLNCPKLLQQIQAIFDMNSVPETPLTPDCILMLLHLIKDAKINAQLQEIPQPLLEIILNMNKAEDVSSYILNKMHENHVDLLSLFKQLVENNPIKLLPRTVKNWILVSLPNGRDVAEYLEYPDSKKCAQAVDGSIQCIKTEAEDELKNFIFGIVNDNELNEPSLDILQYLLDFPNLLNHIQRIFVSNNLSQTQVTPECILHLLNLIKDAQTYGPLQKISQNVFDIVLKLKGAEDISSYIFNGMPENDIVTLIKTYLKNNGGEMVPSLEELIFTLQNGQDIMRYLTNPQDSKCAKTHGSIQCTEPEGNELTRFIIELINNKNLYKLSEKALDQILSDPKLLNHIRETCTKQNLKTTDIHPDMIMKLLFLIKNTRTNSPIADVPESLLKLVMNLKGAKLLTSKVMDWANEHEIDMVQLFFQVIAENGGKVIPENLRAWLLTMSNGEEFIKFLQKEGTIKCEKQADEAIMCVKTVAKHMNKN